LCMPEPIFMKLNVYIYIYIMAPEPISAAYFINASHQSMCIVVRQRLSKYVTAATKSSCRRCILCGLCRFKEVGD
jgi:hypothetical protein